MSTTYQLWKKMRMPFTIPHQFAHLHTCEWETIDSGEAACIQCGAHHVCGDGKCTQCEETHEGTVCLVTGVCIRTKNFTTNEFDDNYPTYVRQMNMTVMNENSNLILCENINVHVQRFFDVELASKTIKTITPAFDAQKIADLLAYAKLSINRLVCVCKWKLHMKIKQAEIRNISIGLLYLMKTGIRVHNVCVLPCIEEFHHMLPPESTLIKNHNFKPKHITDVENKFKFFFRDVNMSEFGKLGLHLQTPKIQGTF